MLTAEGSRDEILIGGASSFLDEVEVLGICWLWSADELEIIMVHGKGEGSATQLR
jgi:hypothetical protein